MDDGFDLFDDDGFDGGCDEDLDLCGFDEDDEALRMLGISLLADPAADRRKWFVVRSEDSQEVKPSLWRRFLGWIGVG